MKAKALGIQLRKIRKNAGLTLRDIEKASNGKVLNGYLCRLEGGHHSTPSPRILRAFAAACGLSYVKLLMQIGFITQKEVARFLDHHASEYLL